MDYVVFVIVFFLFVILSSVVDGLNSVCIVNCDFDCIIVNNQNVVCMLASHIMLFTDGAYLSG